jgi:hypothetical protein
MAMHYVGIVTREQWPAGESPLVWCGHGHREYRTAEKCVNRLAYKVPSPKRWEVVQRWPR